MKAPPSSSSTSFLLIRGVTPRALGRASAEKGAHGHATVQRVHARKSSVLSLTHFQPRGACVPTSLPFPLFHFLTQPLHRVQPPLPPFAFSAVFLLGLLSFILLLPPPPGILSQLSSLIPSSFYSASTYLPYTPPLASPVSLFSLSLSRLPSPNVAALTNFIRGMAVAATAPRLNEIIHCRTCSCEIIHGTMCVCACVYGCACECVILTSATCRPLSSRSSNSSLRESRELAIFPYRPGKNGSPRSLRFAPRGN